MLFRFFMACLFFSLCPLLRAERASEFCSFMSEKELVSWQKRIGVHPEKFFLEKTQLLHSFIQGSSSNEESKTRLFKEFNGFIRSDLILAVLPVNDNFASSLSDAEKTARDYLLLQWLAEKYLGLIRRTVFHPQLKLYRQQQLKSDLISDLAPLRIKEIKEFECSENFLQLTECGPKILAAKVQFYPQLFCSDSASVGGEIRYVLKLGEDPNKPVLKIIEISHQSETIINDSLQDLKALNVMASPSEIRRLLEKWAFTTLQKKENRFPQPLRMPSQQPLTEGN